MTLITFTSDYGMSDHYVALAKANIVSLLPEARIIDISHQIEPFNISHMAHVLGATFKTFPEGTIHLIGSNDASQEPSYIIALLDNHTFVGPNNGVISLLSEQTPSAIFEISSETSDPFLLLPQVAAKLAMGQQPEDLGTTTTSFNRFVARKARATKKEIAGHVIHVDHFGNLITNIEKVDFDILSKNKRYTITFGRDSASQINQTISEVEQGDVFFVFNVSGKLMLGMNHGNGAKLLGLGFDSPILIQFEN